MEYTIDGTNALFEAGKEGWILKQLNGRPVTLALPRRLPDGGELREIAAKALLGQTQLTSLTIPDSVIKIGDWAMAGCRSLNEVHMPECILGKGVFRDCAALVHLYVGEAHDTSALLAEAARQDAAYLLQAGSIGSTEWYAAWDRWLKTFLEETDQEGYTGQVPCGEEDYWNFDVAAYESARRMEKAQRSLLRLKNPAFLGEDFREELRKYIRGHSAGSPLGNEAWQLILTRHAEEEDWYAAFAEAGGLDLEDPETLIADIPDSFAAMKSFFLRFIADHRTADPLWDKLEI